MQVLRCPQVLQSDEMSSTGPPFSNSLQTSIQVLRCPQVLSLMRCPLPVLRLKFSTDFDTGAEMSSSPPV